jgi:hypothetical protein
MINPLLRPAGLALLVGLTAFGGPVTEAASIGVNLSIRSPAPVLSPSVYSGGGRSFTRDYENRHAATRRTWRTAVQRPRV